jgi:hypothetical protein
MDVNRRDVLCHACLFNVTWQKTVVPMKSFCGASQQYVHLAMAHGAGHADSTILGKNGVLQRELNITSFGPSRKC